MNLIEVLPAFGVVVTLVGVGIKAGMVLKTLEHAVHELLKSNPISEKSRNN